MDNEICRLCLSPKDTLECEFKNIFTNVESFDTKQIKLVDAIMDCAPIQIRPDDNLPKLACLECIDKLQVSYLFRQTCLQSDTKLKLLYNVNNNSKSIKNEDTVEDNKPDHDLTDGIDDVLIKYEDHSDSDHHGDKENESPDEDDEEGDEVTKHQCSLCDATFESEANLKKHIVEHENKISRKSKQKSSKIDISFLEDQCKICNAPYCSKDFHLIKSRAHNEGKPFICKLCGKGFKQKAHLSVHWKTHTGEKSHTCNICMKSFITKSNLKTHKINKHFKTSENKDISKELEAARKSKTTDNYLCVECDEKFKSYIGYKKHMEIHSGERPFVCPECGMGFKQKIHLSIHTKSHTGEKQYGCDLCPKQFTTRSVLKAHILRVHSEDDLESNVHFQNDFNDEDSADDIKNDIKREEDGISDQEKSLQGDDEPKVKGLYACSQCDKSFLANAALQDHLRIHTGERPFVCDFCGKGFKQKAHLTIHKKSHTGEKSYTCDICSKSYITNSALRKHMQVRHATLPKPLVPKPRKRQTQKIYNCKYCPKTFFLKHMYIKHSRTHTGESPYMCEMCGKTFKQNSHLKSHKRMHTGEKPYPCNLCPKAFATGTELRVHKIIHSDEFPHKCSMCDKRFKWRITAWRHMMYHTGEKPNKCTICSKAFIEGGALRRHMRVHTGERPQKCNICYRTFKETSHLKTHMNIHNT